MSFQRFLQLIKQRDPVSPGSVNRPIEQLDGDVGYLWEIIQAANLGSTVYARRVTIAAECQVGQAVWLNGQTQRFEPALAQMDTDLATGILYTAPTAQVWGIVAEKLHATLADLLLFGYADIDIGAAVDGEIEAGTYYLSGTAPGMLVRQRPPVTVPVLRATTNGKVFVVPHFIDFLDSHRHYRFDLVCAPAGLHQPPEPGGRHAITSPNADWPGWLPADHESFEGLAPQGAAFGYNLNAHPQLKNAWPPIPIGHSYLEIDRAATTTDTVGVPTGFTGVPIGPGGLAIIDRYGLWWMSDCYGDVPWPTNLETISEYSQSISEEHVPPECPRDSFMRLVLWFTKINFATDTSVVTSLVSLDDRLKIYCAGTTATGSVGDLAIDLDLNLTMGDTDRRGYLAMKVLDDDTLHRGPVAEGIYTTSVNVTLTSDHQTLVDPADENGPVMHHGRVQINVAAQPTREIAAILVRLDGAVEENYPVLYVGLPSDSRTGFVARFDIPEDVAEHSNFQLRLRVLGRSAGNLPTLAVQQMTTLRPEGTTPVALAEDYASMTIDTTAAVGADEAVEVTSETIVVEPGAIVYVSIYREPADDGYSGEVGLMQLLGILTAPTQGD